VGTLARTLTVDIEALGSSPLIAERDGYFAGAVADAQPGIRRDSDAEAMPDPVSRFQPDGPDGASEIIDPSAFAWTDGDWCGPPREELVVYEMHIGTFTAEGSWEAAGANCRRCPSLA
jgi:maltooligosyltrehalose trehalohydrolase